MTADLQGDGSGVALPKFITVTPAQLREAIGEYIVQSRTGAVLSYQATAAMRADDVADSSAAHLWGLLESLSAQGSLDEMLPAQGAEFVAAEDIGAGQWVTFNANSEIVALATTPKAKITLIDATGDNPAPAAAGFEPTEALRINGPEEPGDDAGGFFDA